VAGKVARASQSLISPPFFINQKTTPQETGEDLKYKANVNHFLIMPVSYDENT